MRGVIVLCLLVVLAGCGASEQQKITKVIRVTDAAFDRSDLDKACEGMTERARRRYIRDGLNPGARTCREAYDFHEPAFDGEVLVSVTATATGPEPPRLTKVRVSGDDAVATYSDGDRTRLRKIDGRWLIDSF